MIGIGYHSPVILSIFLDRSRYRNQLVKTDDVLNDSWKIKVQEIQRSPHDGRQKILFVEKLSALQYLVRRGLVASQLKIVVFDTCDVLERVQGLDIIDSKMSANDTWSLYKLLPDRFNEALDKTESGVLPGIESVNSSPAAMTPITQPDEPLTDHQKFMSNMADMSRIASESKAEASVKEKAQAKKKRTKKTEDLPPKLF